MVFFPSITPEIKLTMWGRNIAGTNTIVGIFKSIKLTKD
jgi:hypothetical protein